MFSDVKRNDLNLTRFDFKSGVIYLRSPKQGGFDQATVLFVQHKVGKRKSYFSLSASYPREK